MHLIPLTLESVKPLPCGAFLFRCLLDDGAERLIEQNWSTGPLPAPGDVVIMILDRVFDEDVALIRQAQAPDLLPSHCYVHE